MSPDELRAEFERQHSGRNLRINRNGNYFNTSIQMLWRQHQRTARWMEERADATLKVAVNALADVIARDLEDPS